MVVGRWFRGIAVGHKLRMVFPGQTHSFHVETRLVDAKLEYLGIVRPRCQGVAECSLYLHMTNGATAARK